MSDRPEPLSQVLEIKPYVPGHAPPSRAGKVFKLASNENPLGCSSQAKAAIVGSSKHSEVYPDGDCSDLRRAIAKRYGLDERRIVCGAGSDEIFQLLARAFLERGDNIVQSRHGFLVYQLVAQQCGAETRFAPETDLRADVDALLDLVDDRTKVVFLANPNNPTGTYLTTEEVRRLHASLPKSALLVLDAAYAEYVSRNDYTAGVELVSEFENVLMTRTFSKIHGLAGLRLGWAYGPAHVIDAINRVRGPFNVSAPAQLAGVAAIQDEDFVARSRELNDKGLQTLSEALRDIGVSVTDSVGNFVLVRFKDDSEATSLAQYLEAEHGVSVRTMKGYGLPDSLRITVGDAEGVSAVINGVKAFFKR